jgi:hypothetical protein
MTYNFNDIFEYTKLLIWDKFHEIPDETTFSFKNGFMIIWSNHELNVYPFYIQNIIIIEFRDNFGHIQYLSVSNMDDVYKYVTIIINRISPYKVY